jgi:hypothetical protein
MLRLKRKQVIAGSIAAFTAALLSAFLPLWPVMQCGAWECRFSQGHLLAAATSFSQPQNQPEAANALRSVLPSELLALLAIIVFGFVVGAAVARLVPRP